MGRRLNPAAASVGSPPEPLNRENPNYKSFCLCGGCKPYPGRPAGLATVISTEPNPSPTRSASGWQKGGWGHSPNSAEGQKKMDIYFVPPKTKLRGCVEACDRVEPFSIIKEGLLVARAVNFGLGIFPFPFQSKLIFCSHQALP